MNVIARLEYELAYYDSAVRRFNHYTTRTPPFYINDFFLNFSNIQIRGKVFAGGGGGGGRSFLRGIYIISDVNIYFQR